ncbi:MAG: DUF5329 family protein [Planctomycetota bacterium]|jgi:hypothetical protein
MQRFRLSIISYSLVILALSGSEALGLMMVEPGGKWPENWPSELEHFRFKASTGHFMAGAVATYYYIPFDTREEFERAWPAILKLKSKGAPLSLYTIDPPKTDPNDTRVVTTGAKVAIVCPEKGTYRKMSDGSYEHQAEWTEHIKPFLADGILPQFVGRPRTPGPHADWVIVNPKEHDNILEYGRMEQARVELMVHVDGSVIDLNRIRLPENTPIRDNRKLETDLIDPNSQPLPYTFTVIQRRSLYLPGFDKKVRMKIGDITAGQVIITISGQDGAAIVTRRSVRSGDVVTFSVDKRKYKLKLRKLTNYLIGDDKALFELWPVDGQSRAALSEEDKIEQLIIALGRLKGAKFVRNAREHSAEETVEHLREKWKRNKSEITTAEDFIRLAASKSAVTGAPYIIKLADGTEITSQDWFQKQLAEIERKHSESPDTQVPPPVQQ